MKIKRLYENLNMTENEMFQILEHHENLMSLLKNFIDQAEPDNNIQYVINIVFKKDPRLMKGTEKMEDYIQCAYINDNNRLVYFDMSYDDYKEFVLYMENPNYKDAKKYNL